MNKNVIDSFRLNDKLAVITGGAGLLGTKHAEAIAEAGGSVVLWDINEDVVKQKAKELSEQFDCRCEGMCVDITDADKIKAALQTILNNHKQIDILINNAANDPKVDPDTKLSMNRIENFTLDMWSKDIAVGLTGAFLCSREIGSHMANSAGGVILNIASDLGVIAPDQRIYREEGLSEEEQNVKPVTYSVVKHGLIGLTKYLASYWAEDNVRVNAISPGGIYTNQPDAFVKRLTNLIPMGRMADRDEYKAAVLYLVSEASSYMTGSNLVVDGGRTVW